VKATKTKVKCVHAATRYYQSGQEYTVYTNGDGNTYIKGSDGLYDNVAKTLSKFVKVEDGTKQRKE
jgi:hypothetical protein